MVVDLLRMKVTASSCSHRVTSRRQHRDAQHRALWTQTPRRMRLCVHTGAPMVLVALLMVAGIHNSAASSANFTVAAAGFAWAENMICVEEARALFVSENKRGELWRVTWDGSRYSQSLMAAVSADFELFAGLATDEATGQLFALGNRALKLSGRRVCVLIEVNTSSACDVACSAAYLELATLPRACLGDGLALDASDFYSANEGSFIPLRGLVFRIDRQRKDLSSPLTHRVDHKSLVTCSQCAGLTLCCVWTRARLRRWLFAGGNHRSQLCGRRRRARPTARPGVH